VKEKNDNPSLQVLLALESLRRFLLIDWPIAHPSKPQLTWIDGGLPLSRPS
jgi:hypothetical protein